MSSNQTQFGTGLDQAALAMGAYLKQQPRYEILGSVFAMFWLIGGLFSDKSLYLLSMLGSTVLFVGVLLTSLIPSKKLLSYAHNASFRRLFVSVIARWGYTTGRSKGAKEMELLNFTIPINELADFVLLLFFITWVITKYGEEIDKDGFFNKKAPILLIRGVFRGIILVGAFWSIIDDNLPETFQLYLFISYLLEPYVYYIFAKINPSLSSTDMVLGNHRLPMVALRESFFTNILLLLITIWFKGVNGDEWGLLRVYYLLGSAFIFYTSFEEIKNYKLNPLGKGSLADFLNNTPINIENLDVETAIGMVIDKEMEIDLGESLQYNLQPGSVLVPLKESKNQVTALVLGKAETITKSGLHNLSEMSDGITSLVIPRKRINTITQNLTSKRLSDLNFKELNLPTLSEIQSLLGLYSTKMAGWVSNIRSELTKFDLSNYGVSEMDGITRVTLPGISVIEGPGGSSVKVMGIRVLDTPQASTVRIGSWLSVVEFPKFSMVSLPGIKVLEVPKIGSAVNVFGFKVSDNLPAEYLEEVFDGFTQYLDQWEERIDSRLGKILANQNSNISLNMSWEGELKPLLADNSQVLSDQLLLVGTTPDSRKQINARSHQRDELLMLTGISEEEGQESNIIVDAEGAKISRGGRLGRVGSVGSVGSIGRIGSKQQRKEERDQRKQDKLNRKLDRAQDKIDAKLGSIQDSLDSVKDETKKPKSKEFSEIIDVGYEIVDDEPDDDSE